MKVHGMQCDMLNDGRCTHSPSRAVDSPFPGYSQPDMCQDPGKIRDPDPGSLYPHHPVQASLQHGDGGKTSYKLSGLNVYTHTYHIIHIRLSNESGVLSNTTRNHLSDSPYSRIQYPPVTGRPCTTDSSS